MARNLAVLLCLLLIVPAAAAQDAAAPEAAEASEGASEGSGSSPGPASDPPANGTPSPPAPSPNATESPGSSGPAGANATAQGNAPDGAAHNATLAPQETEGEADPQAGDSPDSVPPPAAETQALAAPTALPQPARPTSLGQAIVGFHAGQMPALAAGDWVGGLQVLRAVPQGPFLVVAAADLGGAESAFAQVPGVAYVEDDVPLRALVTPNDPSYGSQYGPGMMGFPAAWGQAGYGSSSVKVAVIDSGLYRTHADFTPSTRFLAGYDYVNGDGNPNDDCGHGTHVTGTVAATTNNGVGVAGMSQATILPLKGLGAVGGILSVECSGSTSGIAQAILDAAAQGADVISMSIGGGATTTLENAVNSAWSSGVVLVAAAGNDGASNSIDYPGAYANVIAVGALTSGKVRASYSDMGPQLDVMAPGSGVLSTYNNGGYTNMDGTSMATPHVSGALALALSCAPSATNVQLRNALLSTAEDLGASGFDNTYGNGLARVDLMVQSLCSGGGGNQAPTASFTHSESGLTTSVNGGASSDADGTIVSYAWTFGDGGSASGATASHAYATGGTYTVTLTVTDDDGATAATSQSVTVSAAGDPDPSTPNLQSGVGASVQVPAGQWVHRKIQVPAGATNLAVQMAGPAGGDADLYTRFNAKPTSSTYACRPYLSGNSESCTHANPTAGWWYVSAYGYSGSPTVTLTATVTVPAPNNAPTASFTHSESGLTTSVNGGASSDPDGDPLTFAWSWGDGTPNGSGATASHTYASSGTRTVTLTVSDGRGGSHSTSQSVTVTAPPDPDPSTPTINAGQTYTYTMSGAGDEEFVKVQVPAGATQLQVVMDGPACGLLSCSLDADLYTRLGSRPTDAAYDCRPFATGSDETCTHASPAAGWWYIRVDTYSGSGSLTLRATVT